MTMIGVPAVEAEVFPVFIDSEGINKSAVRWLFFPGDVLSARRKRELREAAGLEVYFKGAPFRLYSVGGEEVGAKCVKRTKQVVPRCMLTPLEIGHDWTPPEMIATGAETVPGGQLPAGTSGEVLKWTKVPLPGVKMWPGEALRAILQVSMNDMGTSKGLVEIGALAGMTWEEIVRDRIQHAFFPDYPTIPATLRGIEEQIVKARSEFGPGILYDAADQMLSACDQFRNWAFEKIRFEEVLVSQAAQGGFVNKFSEVAESLMLQLEYTAKDRKLQSVAEQSANLTATIAEFATREKTTDPALVEAISKLSQNQDLLMQAVAALMNKDNEKPNGNRKT